MIDEISSFHPIPFRDGFILCQRVNSRVGDHYMDTYVLRYYKISLYLPQYNKEGGIGLLNVTTSEDFYRPEIIRLASGLASILDRFETEDIIPRFSYPSLDTHFSEYDWQEFKEIAKSNPISDEEWLIFFLLMNVIYAPKHGTHPNLKRELEAARKFIKNSDALSTSNSHDLVKWMDPLNSQYGDDEYRFVKFAGWNKNFSSKHYRDTLKLLWTVLTMDEEGKGSATQLKDVAPMSVSEFNPVQSQRLKIERLPLSTKRYRDYLLDLPVNKVVKLLESEIDFRTLSAEIAINDAEKIIEETEASPKTSVDLAFHAYTGVHAALNRMNDHGATEEWCLKIHKMIFVNSWRTNLVTALSTYLHRDTFVPKDLAYLGLIVELMMTHSGIEGWLRQIGSAEFIVESLVEVAGDNACEFILSVYEYTDGTGTSFTMWKKLIEEYKSTPDAPVSWLFSLA